MTFVFISVLFSVAVSLLFKLAPRWRLDLRQVIAGSYPVAAVLCAALLQAQPSALWRVGNSHAWFILIALGILLPSLFWVFSISVARVGMVRTDAAQRLSLLIPLVVAFTWLGEVVTWAKVMGVVIGLVAIGCIVVRRDTHTSHASGGNGLWPAIVFVGAGVIDVLFKLMAMLKVAAMEDVLLATFILAFIVSGAAMGFLTYRRRVRWRWRNGGAAVGLGVLNFGNIYFYIKAHMALPHDPALVFSAMDIGVIILATLLGVVALRERPGRLNYAGLVLAVVAIIVLAKAY